MGTSEPIRISSIIITNSSGQCLLVRKRGTRYFIQPGGKIEPGESKAEALVRELQEELNLSMSIRDFSYVGCFTDKAINEPGRTVIAEIYHTNIDVSGISPAAEIEEIIWYSVTYPQKVLLAPLTKNHLIPLITALSQKGDLLFLEK